VVSNFSCFSLNADIKHKALSGNTICIRLVLLQRGTSTLSVKEITHQGCQSEVFALDGKLIVRRILGG
jgi:hypothetical protein